MNSLYRLLGISKQAVHQHRKRQSLRQVQALALYAAADRERKAHPGCGMRTLYDSIQPQWIGRDGCIALLDAGGYRLSRPRKKEKTTVSGHLKLPNLIEGMELTRPNQLWQSDTTYFRMGNGEVAYITFIIDVYDRMVKGCEVADNLRAEVNQRLLKRTIREQGGHVEGLIHHSDRGSQYGSTKYLKLQRDHQMTTSMGFKGQDNAYAERINGIIKNEYLAYWSIGSLAQLKLSVRQAVDHYNTRRRYSALSKKPPATFAKEWLSLDPHERPKVTVYAEGKPKAAGVSNPCCLPPQKSPSVPNCPWDFFVAS